MGCYNGRGDVILDWTEGAEIMRGELCISFNIVDKMWISGVEGKGKWWKVERGRRESGDGHLITITY